MAKTEDHHPCWTSGYSVGGVSFLPALCCNLLTRTLIVFHLHSTSCCVVALHFLSWLYLGAGHVAETLAGQRVGNISSFRLSENLSCSGVWEHVRIFSPGQKTNSPHVGPPTHMEETPAGVTGLCNHLPRELKSRALTSPRLAWVGLWSKFKTTLRNLDSVSK